MIQKLGTCKICGKTNVTVNYSNEDDELPCCSNCLRVIKEIERDVDQGIADFYKDW
jgi:transcription initiation factor TFIIIB Brf1 subunit/transcription initiation factor TFIIB